MFSGKSTALLQRMEKYLYAKKHILLIRPKKDNRGYFTHSEQSLKKLEDKGLVLLELSRINAGIVSETEKKDYDAVFIDECFMIPGASQFCYVSKFDVYFAGLLASSEGIMFEEVVKILPFCDSVKFLQSVCVECGNDASMTLYVGRRKKTSDVVVDTHDTLYKPVCRACWLKLNGEVNK